MLRHDDEDTGLASRIAGRVGSAASGFNALKIGAGVATAALVISAGMGSYVSVPETTRGLVYTMGKLGAKDTSDLLKPGPNFKIPFFQSVKLMPVGQQRIDLGAGQAKENIYTKDSQDIDAELQITYVLPEDRLIDIAKKNPDYVPVLVQTARQAVKDSFGRVEATDIPSTRNALMAEATTNARQLVSAQLGIHIQGISMPNFEYNSAFKAAVTKATQMKAQAEESRQAVEKTKADADSARERAKGAADAVKTAADADLYKRQKEAEGQRVLAASIGERNLPAYWFNQTWKGELPQYMGSATPLMDISKIVTPAAPAAPTAKP